MAWALVSVVDTVFLEGFCAQAQWNVAQAAIKNIATVRPREKLQERGNRLIRVTWKTT
jgi:hypothetical protein